ncbi:Leucine-responsive regulatory protein [Andreprevotia sp. IGB-42]|uniref:Lrp/AsnC ligand binding domain-containing protein n=1 Tax=Andreprevotia sp. IGB-42 TaxID=2497473 RepID=UPI00135CDC37|nr:Lrp/AsnC ligand binding domain-containing protein [Andreprevotia sp. IGB-42]KAF0812867.1 Leucine-responsive regulatory protein [Andreprevotia sp. IGB-42]
MAKLDQIDVAILEALQQQGRMTNVALAKQVGLSTTPCLERVRSLEETGVIRSYAAQLSAEQVGLGLMVFIEVALDRTSEAAFEDFRVAVLGVPEIQECFMVAGGFDYLLKIRVPDMASYRSFLGKVLSGIPGIRVTHSYTVMEAVKESSAVSLNHLASKSE